MLNFENTQDDVLYSVSLTGMTPEVGMEFESEDEAYNFYSRYSDKMGFSVRKSVVHWNKKGQIVNQNFCCSKQVIEGTIRGALPCNIIGHCQDVVV